MIDLTASKGAGTIDLGDQGRPHGVRFLSDGRTLVVTAESSGSLLLVDVIGRRVLRAVPTEQAHSHVLVLDADGARVLISNADSGDVAVFDVAARQEPGRIPLRFSALEATDGRIVGLAGQADAPVPVGLLISRDGARAWVATTNADFVAVLDLDSLEVAGRIRAGRSPDGLGWTPVTPFGM